jgi:phosphate transport system protein
MLRRALDAFSSIDAEAARRVIAEDDRIDAEENAVISAALRDLSGRPGVVSEAVDMILVAKNLERVADHATNIAESVILIAEARNVKHAEKLGR